MIVLLIKNYEVNMSIPSVSSQPVTSLPSQPAPTEEVTSKPVATAVPPKGDPDSDSDGDMAWTDDDLYGIHEII